MNNNITNHYFITKNLDFSKLTNEQELRTARKEGMKILNAFQSYLLNKSGPPKKKAHLLFSALPVNLKDCTNVIDTFKANRIRLNLQIAKYNKKNRKKTKPLGDVDFTQWKTAQSTHDFWIFGKDPLQMVLNQLSLKEVSGCYSACKAFHVLSINTPLYVSMKMGSSLYCNSIFKKHKVYSKEKLHDFTNFTDKLLKTEDTNYNLSRIEEVINLIKDTSFRFSARLILLQKQGKKLEDKETRELLSKHYLENVNEAFYAGHRAPFENKQEILAVFFDSSTEDKELCNIAYHLSYIYRLRKKINSGNGYTTTIN